MNEIRPGNCIYKSTVLDNRYWVFASIIWFSIKGYVHVVIGSQDADRKVDLVRLVFSYSSIYLYSVSQLYVVLVILVYFYY